MNKAEKESIISQLEKKITDWDTSFNHGRNDGLKTAIEIIKALPEDPEQNIKTSNQE